MVERKTYRCAIYTRKSSEYGLEQDFNSLDAQREACQAYIKSQANEGWKLLPGKYDDGGISGATLVREGVQSLLADIKAGLIDIVVVYKVDRLTRSLADFAKLVELFETHNVSFVSVTQQFNTTTSMGRLTLNVLLSFAQFQREVTAERIRDKIAASKQKGLWMGGVVPLGYMVKDRKLLINEEEADTVRTIFRRYLEIGSLTALQVDLTQRGIRTKTRAINGQAVGGIPFYKGPLAHLLKNRIYAGEIDHKGKIYPGQHTAIIDRETFEAVQTKLAGQAAAYKRIRRASGSLLLGKLYDDAGNRMTSTHAQKGSTRYRYYISTILNQGGERKLGSIHRISTPEIEAIVIAAIRLQHPKCLDISDRDLIETFLEKVVASKHQVEAVVRCGPEKTALTKTIVIPFKPKHQRPERGIIPSDDQTDKLNLGMRSERRETLLVSIAKARAWADDLVHGRMRDIEAIAQSEQCSERQVRRILSLAFLSPNIVKAAVDNTLPGHLIMTKLWDDVPLSWSQQHALFGL
jgi:DNA invertase Pin-like site-specific DNA recombinase